MRKHYERILHDSESRVQRYLDIQILDENSPFCGGFPKADSLAEPKTAIYRATTMTACYLNPESRYYLDAELGRRLALALAFVRRSQRPGGYFDLINCNFFSGPDTAFCTKRLLPAYVYLCKVVDGALPAAPEAKAAAAELKPKYEAIIRDAADALCHCGFHTPNHRWAIASVLMLCAKLFDKPECRTAAEAILKEGNDCNEDGEYAERSAGNYNRINNDAMIMLAVATGDESYYAPVLRNLEMMLTYIDPDDSIFTNNSTRWDMGKKIYPREYYLEYLYMGYTCRKPELLDAANAIMQMVERHALRSFDCLINLMLLPELAALEHEGSATPTNYHKYYEGSGHCALPPRKLVLHDLEQQPELFVLPARRLHADRAHRRELLRAPQLCPRSAGPQGRRLCPAPDHDRLVLPALCRKARHQRLVADGQRPPRKALRPRHGI